jgi:hypothetical protein
MIAVQESSPLRRSVQQVCSSFLPGNFAHLEKLLDGSGARTSNRVAVEDRDRRNPTRTVKIWSANSAGYDLSGNSIIDHNASKGLIGFSISGSVRCVLAIRFLFVLFLSKIVIRQVVAMVVGFEPMVQKDLVQIRSDNFLAEFVGLGAYEWHPESREACNE